LTFYHFYVYYHDYVYDYFCDRDYDFYGDHNDFDGYGHDRDHDHLYRMNHHYDRDDDAHTSALHLNDCEYNHATLQ
jgi:hypothetical protein